jgi:protein dithiol oxidoreductase (disulfide-forming)
MDARRRNIVIGLGLAPLGMLGLAPHAALAQPRPGANFTELNPAQPVEAKGKVEVIEFFWYGCPHCYALEPLLEDWVKRLPADAEFRRVPAVLSQTWLAHAQVYYAFEALNVTERLHRPFFDAVHRDRLQVNNQQVFEDWLRRNDVDPKKFADAARSFGVQSQVKRASRVTAAYRIDGVPALAVHGRFTVSAGQAPSREGMLEIADYLIGESRKSLAAAK